MLGHFCLTLTPAQEDRVLTSQMGPVITPEYRNDPSARCLFMVVHRIQHADSCHMKNFSWPDRPTKPGQEKYFLGDRYDQLCRRFTVTRINAAIRNRVLSNIARRTLAQKEATV